MATASAHRGKKALIARWDPSIPVNLNEAPCGYTDEGYKDFRGLPYVDYKKIYASGFSKLDLSYADFSDVLLEGREFVDCRFTSTDFTQIYEERCTFYGCVFKTCSFRKARVGFGTSRYEDCIFERCDFARASFKNAVYRRCTFLENRFNNSFMDATGFWYCTFVGLLHDLVFRGSYLNEELTERYGHPVETGLHAVDFSGARLQMVDCRDGCALDNLKLPSDGSSCLIDVRALVDHLEDLATKFPAHAGEIKLHIASPSFEPESQPVTFCSIYDFQDMVEDEMGGRAIYEEIKARFGVNTV